MSSWKKQLGSDLPFLEKLDGKDFNNLFKFLSPSLHTKQLLSSAKLAALPKEDANKGVNVAVLGADTHVGYYTSFLLKQNSLITVLNLYGTQFVKNIAADLALTDTRCKVNSFYKQSDMINVLKGIDVIAMMGLDAYRPRTEWSGMLRSEAKRLVNLAHMCSKYNPKAVVIVSAAPVSGTLPLVSKVYRKSNWYNPGKLIGCVAVPEIKANSLLARFTGLDPEIVQVPITGGADMCGAVPLFAQAFPIGCGRSEQRELLQRFKSFGSTLCPILNNGYVKPEHILVAEAHAIARIICIVGLGMCGQQNAVVNGFVRQNNIRTCRYLTSLLQISSGGIRHNFGIPFLTAFERDYLEIVLLRQAEREREAEDLVDEIDVDSNDGDDENAEEDQIANRI